MFNYSDIIEHIEPFLEMRVFSLFEATLGVRKGSSVVVEAFHGVRALISNCLLVFACVVVKIACVKEQTGLTQSCGSDMGSDGPGLVAREWRMWLRPPWACGACSI